MHIKAVIAYDGSAFFGFQRQTSTPHTVTQHLEDTLQSLQIHTSVIGSGRTDRGVHATAQVIHFDLPDYWHDLHRLKHILNRKLHSVRIKHLYAVEPAFHARFSAKKRTYRYLFKIQRPSVFEEKYISYYPGSFDPTQLQLALNAFVGEHDFRYFHKTGSEVHSTVRRIYSSRYIRLGDIHIITFEANGFLRSQVRLMVEAALQCAQMHLAYDALKAQIDAKTHHIKKPAPPQGLYLSRITY